MMGEVVNIDKDRYCVYTYFWGVAILDSREDRWLKAKIGMQGQELDLSGVDAIVHENGIEFIRGV